MSNLDISSTRFSKSGTYRQALLYAKIHGFMKNLIELEKPEIMEDFLTSTMALKIGQDLQISIFSTNSHFLTWLQTEVELSKLLELELQTQNLITQEEKLILRFKLG
jgi:hypothetical protein